MVDLKVSIQADSYLPLQDKELGYTRPMDIILEHHAPLLQCCEPASAVIGYGKYYHANVVCKFPLFDPQTARCEVKAPS